MASSGSARNPFGRNKLVALGMAAAAIRMFAVKGLFVALMRISSGPKPRMRFIVIGAFVGAILFTKHAHFGAPSYPLEEVRDPTGAGDTFAGGFIGYVASTDDISEANLRRAVVHGSVLASYNVEDFSLGRMKTLTHDEIRSRYQEFQRIAFFE